MDKVWSAIPQLEDIADVDLRKRVKSCFEEAIRRGGWNEDEAMKIPFTLLIPNCPVSLVEHTAAVVEISINSARTLKKMFPDISIDMDTLISGAILHDVGKFLEYAKTEDDKFSKGDFGKLIRHPFSGAALAYEMKLPKEVVHIIATHAHEGDSGYRSVEAIIVNKADFITFETTRRFIDEKS